MDKNLSILSQYNPKQIDKAVKSLVKKHWGSEEMAKVFLAMDLEEAQLLALGKDDYEVGSSSGEEEEPIHNGVVKKDIREYLASGWTLWDLVVEALNNPEAHWKSR